MSSANNSAGKVDLSNFPDALRSIEIMAKAMEDVVDNCNTYKAGIIENWVGQGRNQFEKSYRIMIRKLKDGADVTWDMYENLIEIQGRLIQADVDAAKASHT